MDELRAQLGAAVAHLQAAAPNPELWNGPAATALTQSIDHISMQVGSLLFDCMHFLVPLPHVPALSDSAGRFDG
jgi:hypothetical protein